MSASPDPQVERTIAEPPAQPSGAPIATPADPATHSTIESMETIDSRETPPQLPGRLVRTLSALWKIWLGSFFSTFLLAGVVVVGWVTRAAQREVLRTWWRRSPARNEGTFAEWAAADPQTTEYATWPHWLRGPWNPTRPAREAPVGPRLRWALGWALGGLGRNLRLGVAVAFNTAVLTLPGTLLWTVAWFAGWQNSFNKGYEHAWFGPTIFILGMLLFSAAMAYVPWGQARQASTGDWRRFYDFRLVWRLIRRRWLASLGVALAWAGASGLVLILKFLPAIAQYVPQLQDLSPAEALRFSERFFGVAALFFFPVLVVLRLGVARIYADALRAGYQAGVVTEDDLGETEWHALRRLGLLTPQSVPDRPWLVRLAAWLATRAGQITAGAAVFAVWLGFSFLVTVSEFIAKTENGRGWWNQPLIQVPWFDYTPQRLRIDAAKESSAEQGPQISPRNADLEDGERTGGNR